MAFTDTGVGTATANFDKTVQALIERKFTEALRAGLINLPKGAVTPASFRGAQNGGNGVFRFTAVEDLDATPASHALTEGVPPAGQTLSIGYEEFTAAQKGDFVRISDVAQFENPSDLAKEASNKVTRQMLELCDNIAKALWLAGTNVLYAGTGNTDTDEVAVGDVITAALLKRAGALLDGSSVEKINGSYVGLMHPYVKFDLTLDDEVGGWIDASRYAGSKQLMNGEIGTFAGIRFIVSANTGVKAASGTGSIDVYSTTILGAKSIAFGDIGTQQTIVEKGGVSDPLHQQMTVGWKAYFGGCLVTEGTASTNMGDPRYVRIESASSI